ncbi:hypothetical protein DVA76_18890, partial [Acinetobacter baumannii]
MNWQSKLSPSKVSVLEKKKPGPDAFNLEPGTARSACLRILQHTPVHTKICDVDICRNYKLHWQPLKAVTCSVRLDISRVWLLPSH